MTQFNTGSYDVQKPSGQCAFTGRRMEAGEVYIATLVEDGESFQRVDVSVEAWDRGERPAELFSYWRAVQPAAEQKKKLFVDDEVLMNLLRRLEDAPQPQRIAFRFVLALILMRKKLLRYDGTERAPRQADDTGIDDEAACDAGHEQEWWLMTPKLDVTKGPLGKWSPDETLRILDPRLDEAGIREVTEQLSEILQAEL